MKGKRGFFRMGAWMLCLLLFAACGGAGTPGASSGPGQGSAPDPEERSVTFFAMDTYMSLRAWGVEPETLERAREEAENLEKRISVTREDSELAVLNREGSVSLSPEPEALLRRALELCRETEGALDISIYPIVRAWGFTTGEHRVPEREELDRLLEKVDYTQILWEAGTVSVPRGMEIDLGSVAKGWTGDRIAALLREAGCGSALLDLGGNIQTLGTKPDGSLWRVAVQDPAGAGSLGVLSVADRAVITSGGYERYFTDEDGVLHWHIMDPKTGESARSGLVSVTVVGEEGVRCDALSTALFVMGEEKAAAFWRAHGDFGMVLVTEDGRVLYTPDLAEAFTPNAGTAYEFEVIPDGEN